MQKGLHAKLSFFLSPSHVPFHARKTANIINIIMSVPTQMKALISAEGKTAKEEEISVPKPTQEEILIKNEAVTLNPTDWKHMRLMCDPGLTLGCDFAGTVVEPSKTYTTVQKGEKVAGFVHGGKYADRGSFAEYLKTDARLVVTVPEGVELERAASVGVGGYTAAQALFQRLQLNLPSQTATQLPALNPESPQLLIWAGSTSVGQWAIQLGRAAGYHVITTASPSNHALLQKMGAAEVYDYRDESVPEKISKEHPRLDAALDCISENGTQSLAVKSLGTKGGKVVVLLKPEKEAIELRKDVEIIHTLAYTCLGHPFNYGRAEFKEEQVQADRDFIIQFANGSQGIFYHLLKNKLITGNRIKLFGQGKLQGILQGLEMLEKGQVSGEKLAFKI